MNLEEMEIMYLEQFLEILNILEKYDNLTEIKKDILIRKEIYLNQLNKLIKNLNTN